MNFVGRRARGGWQRGGVSMLDHVRRHDLLAGFWSLASGQRLGGQHRPAGRFRSAPAPREAETRAWSPSVAIGSASSIGDTSGSTRHPRLGRIVAAVVGEVQLARGTSGLRRWYRRALPPFRATMAADGCRRDRPRSDGPGPTDTLGRAMRDLRISVTDRCNFRCTYCMPKEIFGRDYAFLPRDQVLTLRGDRARWPGSSSALGVEKLRITGGEPLVRRDLPDLIAMLAAIRRPDGGEVDLTLTTNGSALRALAGPLADAGLRRVTVSLDSLDDAVFGAMNGIDFPVARVLDGIDAAIEAGLAPVKINMVVRRGDQRDEHRADGALGARDGRDPALHRVHGRRPLERLAARRGRPGRGDRRRPSTPSWPVEAGDRDYRGEVADRWRYVDGRGEFGVIASVTQPFCRDCTRARLSAEGKLYTCLFAVDGHDLRGAAARRRRPTRT